MPQAEVTGPTSDEPSEALTVIEGARSVVEWTPGFVTTVNEAVAVVRQKREFLQKVMVEGTHYGKIPGAGDKPVLLLPGAQTLSSNMALHPIFGDAADPIEDWTGGDHTDLEGKPEPFLSYRRYCELRRQTGLAPDEYMVVARAEGSCNSWESKYRYRSAGRKCPECGKAGFLMKSKPPRTGYYCWNKPEKDKHGCGAQFREDDKRILEQVVGRVPNPDVLDQANTILKMADKRAYIAATLQATGCADLFTQDLEDGVHDDDEGPGLNEVIHNEKEVKPSQPTPTAPAAPSTPKTPSSEAKSPSLAATPTAPTSAAPGSTDTTTPVAPITPVASTMTAAATAPATSEATTAKTDPNVSPGAATASPSPVAATPSPASAEPPELAFGESQSDTAKELRRQALEKAMQATRMSAERRTPNTQYSDAMIEAKAKLAIANWFKTKRSGVELEQASSEDLMALIEAIDVTLQG